MITPNLKTLGLSICLAATVVIPGMAQTTTAQTGGVLSAAQLKTHFEKFAVTWIPVAITATVPKDGAWAAFAAWDPSTGQAIGIAGYGGAGTLTVNHNGQSGSCFSIGGVGGNLNVGAKSGSISYFQVAAAAGDAVPTDVNQANALYIKLFGAAALPAGQSLSTLKVGPYGKAGAFYFKASTSQSYTTANGKKGKATVGLVKAIALVNGKLSAIWASGSGSVWGKYSK